MEPYVKRNLGCVERFRIPSVLGKMVVTSISDTLNANESWFPDATSRSAFCRTEPFPGWLKRTGPGHLNPGGAVV